MPAEWVESSMLRWIVLAPLLTSLVSGVLLALIRRPTPRGLVVTAGEVGVCVIGLARARADGSDQEEEHSLHADGPKDQLPA